MNTSRYFGATFAITRAYIRRLFRDKTALFFTLIFPVIFLVIFGSLNSGGNNLNFNVAVLNQSETTFAKDFSKQLKDSKTFSVKENVSTFNDAKERMGRGEIDGIIELPKNFGTLNDAQQPAGQVKVYYEQSNAQGGDAIAAVLTGTLDKVNLKLGQPAPPLSVEKKSTATENLSQFDYVFSGLLGFTILSLGVFGLANSMPAEKKTGAFRRLRASPIRASQLILANGLAYLVSGVVSLVLMFVIAFQMFDFNMRGDYFSLITFILLGVTVMFGFGLAIGGWAKNENQSAPLTQLVALPLMFLSGVFFPRFLMPEWLQNITGFLPLSPIVDGLRYIATEGKTLLDLGPQIAILAVWGIVIYAITFRVFRWE